MYLIKRDPSCTILTMEKRVMRPFLKWAGGKTQLIPILENSLPESIQQSKTIPAYIEPFVGGGSFFFHLLQKYHIEKSVIIDINHELILTYRIIQSAVSELIEALQEVTSRYHQASFDEQSKFYYEKRKEYNHLTINPDQLECKANIQKSALLIFINKTCFNGLYRVNQKGFFNVPFGKHKKPVVYEADNLKNISWYLKKTKIIAGDFSEARKYNKPGALFYFDPPYRPISQTASFTSYDGSDFVDIDQKRLADFCHQIEKKGAYFLLSNSDPKNVNPNDNFFDDIFKDYQIARVKARRMINSNSEKRGEINEIVVKNYKRFQMEMTK